MKCFFCKSEYEQGYTTYFSQLKNCVVVIKNVPCMKCPQCGENVFSGLTMKRIDELLDKCETMLTEVAVIKYDDPAA